MHVWHMISNNTNQIEPESIFRFFCSSFDLSNNNGSKYIDGAWYKHLDANHCYQSGIVKKMFFRFMLKTLFISL